MKFTLELEEEQMEVLEKALDMYSRMGMGQLDVAVESTFAGTSSTSTSTRSTRTKMETRRLEEKRSRTSSIGSSSWSSDTPPTRRLGNLQPQVPVASREAYDIRQKVRGALAQWRIDKARASKNDEAAKHILYSVDMDRYLPANQAFPIKGSTASSFSEGRPSRSQEFRSGFDLEGEDHEGSALVEGAMGSEVRWARRFVVAWTRRSELFERY